MALFGFDLSAVPDIDFAQKDVSIIQSEVISRYEAHFYLATRIAMTLGRGDPRRLFLLSIIYQLAVQRTIVDFTGKQNLIKYSRGDYLDNIGARWGPTRGKRIPAKSSECTLRFTLSAPLMIDAIIPYRTEAQSNSGISFTTIREGIIPSGETSIDLPATCAIAGEIGNRILPGQITQLVNWSAPYLITVINITETSGGNDRETDDRYRARIWMAPESFSVAGPYGAYEYWAASANSNITDVHVWSDPPHAGQVYIYFLMEDGRLPTEVERQQVYDTCNAEDIRPLTDQLFVERPEAIDFPVIATFWINEKKAIFVDGIRKAVYRAFDEFKLWQRSEIARDINMSKMIQMLINAGASRVGVISPGLDDVTNHVAHNQVAIADGSLLTYGGLEKKETI